MFLSSLLKEEINILSTLCLEKSFSSWLNHTPCENAVCLSMKLPSGQARRVSQHSVAQKLCEQRDGIHLCCYLLPLSSLHRFLRVISASKGSGGTEKGLQLRLVSISVGNEQHMLDALQHHCSQGFFIKVFPLRSVSLLM